ncbi:Dimer-Tnp-hAT domain containing protein [Pyrenophora tritici-repentis]|nr:Dimer-Tnp-hAT domain containing protein [Pyrenophora tritici-repentis]KAI1560924.1 Dimer-Tnp-hAT domain containing protein [Pyrenophora tritici-repentis]
MPPTKRASNDLTRPKKRVKSSTACGTVSQPIPVNSRLSSSPSRPSPRRALVETSQASTFESQLRESRPEDAIVAPTEGSERVTPAFRRSGRNDAIDSILNPSTASSLTADDDEFQRWKRSEPAAERGTEHGDNPIKYWVSMRDCYPSLSKLVLDVLSILASSCECERLFSELGDLLEPRRRRLGPQLLAAIQCVRRWQGAGLGADDEVVEVEAADDDNMELLCGLATWDYETQH